jgi:hypothetical protein
VIKRLAKYLEVFVREASFASQEIIAFLVGK